MAKMPDQLARAAIAAAALLGAACGPQRPATGQFTYSRVTGTVTVAARDAGQIGLVVEAARSTSLRVLRSLDAADAKSDISRLNKIAATARWPVPHDTFAALDLALHYSRQTDGAFDITTGSLAAMWGLPDGPPPREPPPGELIAAARAGTGAHNVRLTDEGTIAFLSPLTRIDIGEMAPAYALDLSVVNIRRRGVTNAVVRYNSSLRVIGAEDKALPWTEPLRHPDQPARSLGRWVFTRGGALATCGLYDQQITIAGHRYGGIIDPRTGAPATNALGAVVTGPTATLASALARALVVLGPEGATNILARFPRYEALIVPQREPLEIWVTEGFRNQYEPDPAVAGALHPLVPAPLPPEESDDQADDAVAEKVPAKST